MRRLKELRQDRGLSARELSRRAALDPSTLSLIETGRLTPYPVQLQRIAVALRFKGDPEALLDEVGTDA
ncbi:MAG: helix-turn-helix domain-containing protein [Coriobacteriia bacterium]